MLHLHDIARILIHLKLNCAQQISQHDGKRDINGSSARALHAFESNMSPAFLADSGEAGAMMRAFDWSASPIGNPATWSPALRIAVSMVLASPESMYLAWGPS